jgi:hypothetical protein
LTHLDIAKTLINTSKVMSETYGHKNISINISLLHKHFNEYSVDVSEKYPQEHKKIEKNSELLMC